MTQTRLSQINTVLEQAVAHARLNCEGAAAAYIPELAQVPLELTSAAITLPDGRQIHAGDALTHRFTLQSSAKLIVLAGLLELLGEDKVFSVVGAEASGDSFASLARLETHGPVPANPLINAGAIALSGHIPGRLEERLGWIEYWVERLYGSALPINQRVLASERRTGDRNRSIAYLLRQHGIIEGSVDECLEGYFALCSIEGNVLAASRFAAVLANGGIAPDGARVLSARTTANVVALMATCGMYNESGDHLRRIGLPAKSGVSGVVIAVASGRGGIAVASPRVNNKGGSVRGHMMLEQISRDLGWHFALHS